MPLSRLCSPISYKLTPFNDCVIRMFELRSNHLLKGEIDIIRDVAIENSNPTCFIKIKSNLK